jgi:hypothetical protein
MLNRGSHARSGRVVVDPEVLRFWARFDPGGIDNATADPSTSLRFAQNDSALGFANAAVPYQARERGPLTCSLMGFA